MEAHQNLPSEKLPPVTVTVASNDVDFVIKYVFVFLLQFISYALLYTYIRTKCVTHTDVSVSWQNWRCHMPLVACGRVKRQQQSKMF